MVLTLFHLISFGAHNLKRVKVSSTGLNLKGLNLCRDLMVWFLVSGPYRRDLCRMDLSVSFSVSILAFGT